MRNPQDLSPAELEEIYNDAIAQFEASQKLHSDCTLFRIRLHRAGLADLVIDQEIRERCK